MTTVHRLVNGVNLAIDDRGGDGVPFVWAHGLLSSTALEDEVGVFGWFTLPDVRTIRYDARGHGASDGTSSPDDYTWPALAADLLAVMDATGVERCAIGGASMGAATALAAAIEAPARVDRLVVVIPPTAWATRAASRELNLAGTQLVDDVGPQAVVDVLQGQDPPAVLGAHGERWRDSSLRQMLTMDRRVLSAIFRGAAGSDLPSPDLLATVDAPTLVLAWSGDAGHPLSTAERLVDALAVAELHVAADLTAIGTWPGLLRDFLRS